MGKPMASGIPFRAAGSTETPEVATGLRRDSFALRRTTSTTADRGNPRPSAKSAAIGSDFPRIPWMDAVQANLWLW